MSSRTTTRMIVALVVILLAMIAATCRSRGPTVKVEGFLVNGGWPYTASSQVTLTLELAKVGEYQVSEDPEFRESVWEPNSNFHVVIPWEISRGEGRKTLYARTRDAVGQESAAVMAQVCLDSSPVVNLLPPTSRSVAAPDWRQVDLLAGGALPTTTLTIAFFPDHFPAEALSLVVRDRPISLLLPPTRGCLVVLAGGFRPVAAVIEAESFTALVDLQPDNLSGPHFGVAGCFFAPSTTTGTLALHVAHQDRPLLHSPGAVTPNQAFNVVVSASGELNQDYPLRVSVQSDTGVLAREEVWMFDKPERAYVVWLVPSRQE